MLFEKQVELNLKQHKLVQDVCTRWNSTLAMIERIVEQRAALNAIFSDEFKYDLILNDDEFGILNDVVAILTPFLVATELLSGSKYVTASISLPVYYTISNHVKVCFTESCLIKTV